jgi:hypothetical protein
MSMTIIMPLQKPKEKVLDLLGDLKDKAEADDAQGVTDDLADLDGYIGWIEQTLDIAEAWLKTHQS